MSAADRVDIVVMERADEWPDPEPFHAEDERIPYPVDALPPIIGAAVQEVCRAVQAPVEMVATTAISAVATATQGLADVRRDAGLVGPSSINTLVIAGSGERKSAVNRMFFAPIKEREAAERERLAPERQAYVTASQQWEAENDGLLRKIKSASGGNARTAKNCSSRSVEDLKDDHELHQDKKPVPPVEPRTIYQDVTTEALLRALSRYPLAALVSAEAGALLGAHSMQSDKSMAHMSRLNELWDGDSIHTERVSVDSIDLEGVRLSVCLAIQAETLRDFIGRQGRISRGLGFWARFLICEPRTRMGTRFFQEAPASWPHLSAMQDRLAETAKTAAAAVESTK